AGAAAGGRVGRAGAAAAVGGGPATAASARAGPARGQAAVVARQRRVQSRSAARGRAQAATDLVCFLGSRRKRMLYMERLNKQRHLTDEVK
ncbi:unnamed protein product, partial [Urochloa humidicola]